MWPSLRGVVRKLEVSEGPATPGPPGDHSCWRGWRSLRLRRRPDHPFARLSKTLSPGSHTTITPPTGQEISVDQGNVPDQELEGSRKGVQKGCGHADDSLWKGFTKTMTP